MSAAARSRANLRSWLPGQSGNPSGRPKLPEELRAIREFTADEIKRVIAKYGRMMAVEVIAMLAEENRGRMPMLDLAIASTLLAATNGSVAHLSFLLDRAIGKPKEVVEDAGDGDVEPMTPQEALKILKDDYAAQEDVPCKVEDL